MFVFLSCMRSDTDLGESRGKKDFLILRADSSRKESCVLNELLGELRHNSLTGHIIQKTFLPGMDRDDQFQYAVSDSNYIICAFERGTIDLTYTDNVTRSHHSKRKQKLYDHVIPLFCDVSREVADIFFEKNPDLMILSLYEGVFTQDNDWMDRITTRITRPSLGKCTFIT